MKALIYMTLMLASTFSHAGEYVFSQSASPGLVNVNAASRSISIFHIRLKDLPGGPTRPFKTKEVRWKTTHYPYDNINEWVEICYRPYGVSRTSPEQCERILPNAEGIATTLTSLRVGHGSDLLIRHHTSGTRRPARPAGNDSVTVIFTD